jgi:hypothetical protein
MSINTFIITKNETIQKIEEVKYQVEVEIPDNVENKEEYLLDLINNEDLELDLADKIISTKTIKGEILDEEITQVEIK